MRTGYLLASVVVLLSSGVYSLWDWVQPPRTVMHGTGGAELSLLAYAVAFFSLVNLPLALFVFFRRK